MASMLFIVLVCLVIVRLHPVMVVGGGLRLQNAAALSWERFDDRRSSRRSLAQDASEGAAFLPPNVVTERTLEFTTCGTFMMQRIAVLSGEYAIQYLLLALLPHWCTCL